MEPETESQGKDSFLEIMIDFQVSPISSTSSVYVHLEKLFQTVASKTNLYLSVYQKPINTPMCKITLPPRLCDCSFCLCRAHIIDSASSICFDELTRLRVLLTHSFL